MTDQSREQLQVLFLHVCVDPTVVQVHLGAAPNQSSELFTDTSNSRCVEVLPADDPVQGLGADMQSGFDVRVVQVERGGGGVCAGGVESDGGVQGHQSS